MKTAELIKAIKSGDAAAYESEIILHLESKDGLVKGLQDTCCALKMLDGNPMNCTAYIKHAERALAAEEAL